MRYGEGNPSSKLRSNSLLFELYTRHSTGGGKTKESSSEKMNKTHLGLQRKERGIGGPTAQLEEENEEQKERERGWDLGGPIDSLL